MNIQSSVQPMKSTIIWHRCFVKMPVVFARNQNTKNMFTSQPHTCKTCKRVQSGHVHSRMGAFFLCFRLTRTPAKGSKVIGQGAFAGFAGVRFAPKRVKIENGEMVILFTIICSRIASGWQSIAGLPYICQSNRYLEKIKNDDGSGNRHVYRQTLFVLSGFLSRAVVQKNTLLERKCVPVRDCLRWYHVFYFQGRTRRL